MKHSHLTVYKKKAVIGITVLLFGATFFSIFFTKNSIAAALFQKGQYYFQGDAYNLAKAEQMYRWALRFNSDIPLGHFELAKVYLIENSFDFALNEINKEIAANPLFHRAFYVRGLIYGFKKESEKAEDDFKKSLSLAGENLSPTGWAIYNDLAWVQFQSGKYEEVRNTAEAGLKKFPHNPWLLNSLGIAFLNLDDNKNAKQTLEEALLQAEKLTKEEVVRAYPLFDPKTADFMKLDIISRIKFNKTRTKR